MSTKESIGISLEEALEKRNELAQAFFFKYAKEDKVKRLIYNNTKSPDNDYFKRLSEDFDEHFLIESEKGKGKGITSRWLYKLFHEKDVIKRKFSITYLNRLDELMQFYLIEEDKSNSENKDVNIKPSGENELDKNEKTKSVNDSETQEKSDSEESKKDQFLVHQTSQSTKKTTSIMDQNSPNSKAYTIVIVVAVISTVAGYYFNNLNSEEPKARKYDTKNINATDSSTVNIQKIDNPKGNVITIGSGNKMDNTTITGGNINEAKKQEQKK